MKRSEKREKERKKARKKERIKVRRRRSDFNSHVFDFQVIISSSSSSSSSSFSALRYFDFFFLLLLLLPPQHPRQIRILTILLPLSPVDHRLRTPSSYYKPRHIIHPHPALMRLPTNAVCWDCALIIGEETFAPHVTWLLCKWKYLWWLRYFWKPAKTRRILHGQPLTRANMNLKINKAEYSARSMRLV